MRRLFLIFLLTLLPLQASWAAVCAYCPAQCISESAAQESASDPGELNFDGDCNCCQLGGVGIATASYAPRIFPPPNLLAKGDGIAFANSSDPDRPERPNWLRVA